MIEARWGAAAPNADRNNPMVAAGARLWAILTWRLARPLPDARVSVDLMDDAEYRLENSEMSLADGPQATRATISVNQETILTTYHLLMVPPTQPPPPKFDVRLGDAASDVTVVISATMSGQIIHTYADLSIPPDLLAGSYDLRLVSADDGAAVMLGPIAVANRPRQFAAPALDVPYEATFGETIRLLGLNIAAPTAHDPAGQTVIAVAAGQPITLTLAWRVLDAPRRDLIRFLHVLGADGRPVAQEDSAPAAADVPRRHGWWAKSWSNRRVWSSLPIWRPAAIRSQSVGMMQRHFNG